ncbi:PTS lactose/cellobiose transporter subunit IIA [Bacillus sp. EAC]|uniref:PTS lactose/cellobiose transporter subunit IIA n=1 Tax=Bacillus sp. EAC TaxID=1978338 RepID=UPI000B42E175|nr:PTS lactose/cellobiose transporter subunit IIA [Bacillus sp. EAC]
MIKNETEIFTLILHGGNGRSSAMEAIQAAKKGNMDLAREKLKEANEAINEAHHIQTTLIQSEIGGNPTVISLLMIHAQDHLMNAITVKDMAKEFVDMYERGLT